MKYAFFFLIIAAQFFVEAALLGGYFWVLAWPGFSFGLVALAYLGLGPGVFGKQASGSLACPPPFVPCVNPQSSRKVYPPGKSSNLAGL